jgi:RimJ/RimL family protein N-acetyltransferase
MSTVIKSKTCYLRQIGVNEDLARYLYWMQTPSNNPYILSAASSYDLNQLKEFIKICNNRSDVLLLGIFTNENSLHIGNIKFDKIDLVNKSATLGILIGDRSYRGKGIAREVIIVSILWLADNYDIKTIKLGFKIIGKSETGGHIMEVEIRKLSEI